MDKKRNELRHTENDRSATHSDQIEEIMFAVFWTCMCKGWVVREHRREFLDVDHAVGKKRQPAWGSQFTLGGHYQQTPFVDPAA